MATFLKPEKLLKYMPPEMVPHYIALVELFRNSLEANLKKGSYICAWSCRNVIDKLNSYTLQCWAKRQPEELMHAIGSIKDTCLELARAENDPACAKIGEIGMRFCEGMMCFLRPNQEFASKNIIKGIFQEPDLSEMVSSILSEAGEPFDSVEWLAHEHPNIAQKIISNINRQEYAEASEKVGGAITMCRNFIESGQPPILAARMLEVYSIVKYLIDTRARGELLGLASEANRDARSR